MAKFCKKCGAPLEEGDAFCAGCGATLDPAPPAPEAAAPAPEQPAPAPAPPAPPPEAPAPAPEQPAPAPPEAAAPAPPPVYQQPQPGQPQPAYQPPPGQPQPGQPQPAYAAAPAAQKKKFPTWLLIVIIAVVVVVVALFVANRATGNIAGQDYINMGPDQIPSVKLILGEERNISSYNSSTSGGIQTITIVYKVEENQAGEMRTYAEALMNRYEFFNTTPYNFSEPTGSDFVFAADSVEEGFIILLQIDYDTSGYTITLTRGEGTLTKPVEEEPVEEEVEEAPPPLETIDIVVPFWLADFAWDDFWEIQDEEGFEVTQNNDGSLTVTMTEETREMLLKIKAEDLNNMFTYMIASDYFEGVNDIVWNGDFSIVTLGVTDELFDDEGVYLYTLVSVGFAAPLYQIYQGNSMDSTTLIILVDWNTEELIAEFYAPFDLFDLFAEDDD